MKVPNRPPVPRPAVLRQSGLISAILSHSVLLIRFLSSFTQSFLARHRPPGGSSPGIPPPGQLCAIAHKPDMNGSKLSADPLDVSLLSTPCPIHRRAELRTAGAESETSWTVPGKCVIFYRQRKTPGLCQCDAEGEVSCIESSGLISAPVPPI